MRLAELQQILRTADPAAVLVAPRVLDQLIQGQNHLSKLFGPVPHRQCHVVDRAVLYRHLEPEELELEPDRLLPSTVILLARPSPNMLATLADDELLTEYWRRLFHSAIHRALRQQVKEGRLNAVQVREGIEQIGASAFAEIRMVLDQEKRLMPNGAEASDTDVYIEFAAVYLELRYFAANLLPIYFPGLSERGKIDALLARRLDADALFEQTRLAGAPQPVFRTDTSSDESHDYYRRLMSSAAKAEQEGNTVRSAILHTIAARVAPASLEDPTREKAHNDLRRLTRRVQAALELSAEEADEWLKDLPALLDKADQGSWPVEAALLYDLQKVGVDHERDIFALDVVTWVTSGGRRPIKRALPSQRLVRITRHLRSAAQRLTQARLADDERQHFAHLLQSALHHCEERLRSRFRPVLSDALQMVGLQPDNPPERTAFARMIEEMLDRIVELGFLTFSDLRDTISRNQLKMPDLHDPYEFARGDPLLRLDRHLATALDGVYRPGEIYLRWLERLTAPAFGTRIGRWLVLFALLPFGGAAVLLQGVKEMFKFDSVQEFVTDHPSLAWINSAFDPRSGIEALQADKPYFPSLAVSSLLLLGSFLLALLHIHWFRELCKQAVLLAYRALRYVLIDGPLYVLHLPLVQQALKGWPFLLFWSWVFKPVVVFAVLLLVMPAAVKTYLKSEWPLAFLVLSLALNTRLGKALGELLLQSLANVYESLRAGLLPGLLRLLLWIFKQVTDGLEYLLHTVDEWLRFRQGDSQLSLLVRTVAAFLWYPVAWLTRFYLVVLIEPWFNPVKAPVSLLAAKFMYPVYALYMSDLQWRLNDETVPMLMKVAWLVIFLTIWLLPDAFGFLFWETKENWRMYRANRQPQLRPVAIGPHGETVRQLLQPGFHSGTVPKLYARLREAERQAIRTGSWRTARTWRRSLAEVEKTVRRLVERELVKLLQESKSWQDEPVVVGKVMLTPTRIGIELMQAPQKSSEWRVASGETEILSSLATRHSPLAIPTRPVRLEWEDQAGWLVASIREPGWLESLGDEQRQAATTALAGLYKLAGIDLVSEQVREVLPPQARFTLTERDLVVQAAPLGEAAVRYDLTRPRGPLRPCTLEGTPAANWPTLDPGRVLFARVPLSWPQWVESWQGSADGKTPKKLLSSSIKLLPAGSVG